MMPVTIHPLTVADFEAVDPLLTAAYAHTSSMVDVLRRYHQQQPDGWFVARLDGAPAGMGGAILYGDIARIGLVAVDPSLQRRGIGQAVMEWLLAWTRGRGATTILLDASPAGAPLYTRLGFVTDDYAREYRYERAAALPGPAVTGVRPLQPADLPDVVAYDTERFGAARDAVLAQYVADDARRAFVARDSRERVTGYLIAQANRLGPWLADSPDIAAALLRPALPLCSTDVRVATAESNQAALALLERAGFTSTRRLSAMRLGGHPDLQRRKWLYGYANFYFG